MNHFAISNVSADFYSCFFSLQGLVNSLKGIKDVGYLQIKGTCIFPFLTFRKSTLWQWQQEYCIGMSNVMFALLSEHLDLADIIMIKA